MGIPPRLASAVDEDGIPSRHDWLAALPRQIEEIAQTWSLELGEPILPGGQCAWVAPVRDRDGRELVLKVGWRHPEAEHEADALRLWQGDGAVRCYDALTLDDTAVLLLERCVPGVPLGAVLAEPEQDVVVASLLRRLRTHSPAAGHPFRPLHEICDAWADEFETDFAADSRGLDSGIARQVANLLRALPRSAQHEVLLCTDLHAENILSADRDPWLAIDPKPFIGDPAFDAVQHMLNCDERLALDPVALAHRMADLLQVDRERVTLWLFARCGQGAIDDHRMRRVIASLQRHLASGVD
ncbi:MAG: aminoglycoside phosphotransferase family protein [Solirubrobacteraceae bacterium]